MTQLPTLDLTLWAEHAKRDDILDSMVPSDVRRLVGEAQRQKARAEALEELFRDLQQRMWAVANGNQRGEEEWPDEEALLTEFGEFFRRFKALVTKPKAGEASTK